MESSIPSNPEYVEQINVVTPMQLVLDGRVSGESAPLRLLSFDILLFRVILLTINHPLF